MLTHTPKSNGIIPILGIGIVAVLIIGVLFYMSQTSPVTNTLGTNSPVITPNNSASENENTDDGEIITPSESTQESPSETTDSTPGTPVEPTPTIENPDQETPVQPETKLFTAPVPNTSLNFCLQSQDVTDQIMANLTPSQYIDASPYNYYLKIWEELFLERNTIGGSYLNEHIRITDAGIADHGAHSYFWVSYYFIVDWTYAPGNEDSFLIMDKDGNELTYNEIKDQFDPVWGSPTGTLTIKENGQSISIPEPVISSLRVDDKLVSHLISCTQVMKEIHDEASTQINSGHSLLTNDGFWFYGFTSADDSTNPADALPNSPSVTFDLASNNIIDYDVEAH